VKTQLTLKTEEEKTEKQSGDGTFVFTSIHIKYPRRTSLWRSSTWVLEIPYQNPSSEASVSDNSTSDPYLTAPHTLPSTNNKLNKLNIGTMWSERCIPV